jgi:hypothetical protein
MADHRRAAKATAHDDFEANLTGPAAHHAQADVMGLGDGAVVRAAGDCES